MAVILWALGLSLLVQGCLSSVGQTGCLRWTEEGKTDVCCDECHPGHRLVKKCGLDPKDLCTPCESGTYTDESQAFRCKRCTQCVGAQVLDKECTATTDTQCGCREGLTCGDKRCSFCYKKCGKGEEPTKDRACRKCPEGTFNDQDHQNCKPRSKKCPNPDHQVIVAMGDEFNDIKCENVSAVTHPGPTKPNQSTVTDLTEDEWPLALFVVPTIVLMAFIIFIIMIITVSVKIHHGKPTDKTPIKPQIIRTPTDDPCTLVAIECSFHEAQQEQGSSSESLASKDSSFPLIA